MSGTTPAAEATLHHSRPGPAALRSRLARKKFAFASGYPHCCGMMKLCIFAGTTVCAYVAAYAVSSYGMMAEVIASGVGSIIGVYLGWRLARKIDS